MPIHSSISWVRKPDLWIAMVALVYSLPTLAYPFVGDQAVHYYVGRWWLEGVVPYRDSWDIKPPGIFLAHAAAAAVFGIGQVSIRLLDLLTVLLVGWIAAVSVQRDTLLQRGEAGAVILLYAVFYCTCFTYADTAQAEQWEGLFLLGSFVIASRMRKLVVAALLSGILSGIAILFKTPAAVVCLGIAGLLAVRAWDLDSPFSNRLKGLLRTSLSYVAGGCLVGAITLFYFWWVDALEVMLDLNVNFIVHYNRASREPAMFFPSIYDFWIRERGIWVTILFLSWVGGLLSAVLRGARVVWHGALWAAGMVLLAVITVGWQGVFFAYHWVIVVPFTVLAAGYGIAELVRARPVGVWLCTGFLLCVGILAAPKWDKNPILKYSYPDHFVALTRMLRGELERKEYLKAFIQTHENYSDQEAIGILVRRLAKQGDQMLVRRYDAAIYAVADIRSNSRFVHEDWLYEGAVDYRRDERLIEYKEAFRHNPPRFVVEVDYSKSEPAAIDSDKESSRWERIGYREAGRSGDLILYIRP